MAVQIQGDSLVGTYKILKADLARWEDDLVSALETKDMAKVRAVANAIARCRTKEIGRLAELIDILQAYTGKWQ